MYSKKLKQLVKDKVPLKFRIKDEQQSKELQKFLFALDIGWATGSKEIKYLSKPYLFLDKFWVFDYSLFHGDDGCTSCDNNPKEFDLKNDCLVDDRNENRSEKEIIDELICYLCEERLAYNFKKEVFYCQNQDCDNFKLLRLGLDD